MSEKEPEFPYTGDETKDIAQDSSKEKLTEEEENQVDEILAKHVGENRVSVEDIIRAKRKSQEAGEE